MALRDWHQWTSSTARSLRRHPKRTPRRRAGLGCEQLECRLAPTVSTWTGAVNELWSNDGNWDTPPAPGNDLVFPAGASNLNNTDDLNLSGGNDFGSLTFSGSGYTIGGNAIALSGTIEWSQTSGTNTVTLPVAAAGSGPLTVSIDQSGAELVLGGAISGTTGLTETGSGTLDLTAANTYSGTTTVNGGVLDVDGSQSQSPVVLDASTTLGGGGNVGPITASSATVSPGNPAPGTLTATGDLSLDSGSTFSVVLDGSNPGSGYSQLVNSGQVNLGGAALVATAGAGFTPTDNESFTIINNTSASAVQGTFAGLPQGATLTISGQSYTISYDGGDGNDVVLTSQAASTTTLTAAPSAAVTGQPITLTATVAATDTTDTNTPTGTVTFYNGTSSLGTADLSGGTASLPGVVLPQGSNSLTAVYAGDANFVNSASSPTTVTVSQASTSTTLTATPSTLVAGQPVTLTAMVAAVSPGTGTPTGTVEFFSGSDELGTGTLDGSGTATLTTAALNTADTSLTATYEGDSNYLTSPSNAVAVTVTPASTSTTVTVAPNPSSIGQPVTLTASVSAASPGTGTPTGTVTFYSGGNEIGTGSLDASGNATLSVATLALGSNTITAQYASDDNYAASTSQPATATVLLASTTTLVSSSASVTYGQPVTFTATVVATDSSDTSAPTGTVTFYSGTNELGTGTLSGDTAILANVILTAGTDSVTAQYQGDSNFAGSTSSATSVAVAQSSTTTTLSVSPGTLVSGQQVTLTATVAPISPGAGTPTGTVEFFSGTNELGTGTLDGSGTATLTTSALTTADTALTATYEGDPNFTTSNAQSTGVTVTQASTSTTVTVAPNPSGLNQSVTLTATVAASSPGSGTPTGTVTFYSGGNEIGTGTLDGSGTATLATTTLAIGANTITAQYGGDDNFLSSTSPAVTATVLQDATTTLVSSSTSITYGQTVTLTATVVATDSSDTNAPTGTVAFYSGSHELGTATLSGDTAALANVVLPAGSDSVTAQYQGDSNFASSTSSAVGVTVAQAGTTTAVSPSVSSLVSGQEVVLTATVTAVSPGAGTPTGTVTFFTGSTQLGTGTLDGSGTATLTTSALTTADAAITATYGGDTNFTSSTAPAVGISVTEASTTTSLTASPNPATVGSPVTLTATVAASSPGSGTPTGTVTFYNGSTELGTGTLNSSGIATYSTSSLPQGSNSITATYGGDSNFTSSTAPSQAVTVNLASTTTLSASPTSFSSGQTITLTATVAAANSSSTVTPTGTVEFFNGTTSLGTATLSGGVATLSSVSLTATGTITASYSGDTNYAGSTSAEVTVSLVQSTTTTVTTAPNPSVVGQSVTLAAAVGTNSGAIPTGTVMFLDGSIPLGTVALDSTGSALLTLSTLPAGSDSITAQYSGDANDAASTSSAVVQTVNQVTSTTTLTVSPASSSLGQPVTLSVNVASVGGVVPTGTITFLDGSTTLGTATLDDNGNASFTTTALPAGTNSITASYSGDSNFLAGVSTPVTGTVSGSSALLNPTTLTLTLSSTSPAPFSSVQFTAVVATGPGATTSATPTGTVVFYSNGVALGSATLDSTGTATFSASNLAIGSDYILAYYQGDSNNFPSVSSNQAITVGNATQQWLNQVYLVVLNRPIDEAGLTAWSNEIQAGLSRSEAVHLIIKSPEAQQFRSQTAQTTGTSGGTSTTGSLNAESSQSDKEEFINSDYEEILNRPADPTGMQFFVGLVNQGIGSLVIFSDMLGSDEYFSDVTDAMMAQTQSTSSSS